jgi:hypothetical protein
VRRIIIGVAAAAAILLPGLVAAAPASAATPDTECTAPSLFFENVEGAWLSATATSPDPSTIIATKSAKVTEFCVLPGEQANTVRFEQAGTSRCVTLDTSHRTLYTGDCVGDEADWYPLNSKYYPGDGLLENGYNMACIYQNGLGDPVTYNPCDGEPGVTGDVWAID